MKRLNGKIVVITGASSGIGERIAYKAAALGAVPVLIARSEEKLKTTAHNIAEQFHVSCHYYTLDVSNEDKVQEVFARILQEAGPIDVLINNAGFGIFKTFDEASMAEVKSMFEVNVFGLVACTKAVLPVMLKRNCGHIINIASLAGKIATPKSSAYAATKHAVLGFTNSLRLELKGTDIQVTAINPGPIKTNFFEIADQSGTYVQSVEKYMLNPEYVADKIVGTIGTKKRELNLPGWMSAGPVIFSLFPRLFERVAGKAVNKK
ncbi:SDR family oxidoreductase [Bacillus sp. 165]|uniref:SDR family NAD(P)-dependent oxidoreductase n=1 Tax=Bacillus sp. 165 TaxID=1529117 RepID=UPI001ADC6742|nr:SDR family oxidoreductase [Bacillus sp. 165]MBO9129757.1 SDR family oxidoreductase [Bacillus sp. 165]